MVKYKKEEEHIFEDGYCHKLLEHEVFSRRPRNRKERGLRWGTNKILISLACFAFLIGLSGGMSGSVSITPISGCTSINRKGWLS